jgi:hypothetical protein
LIHTLSHVRRVQSDVRSAAKHQENHLRGAPSHNRHCAGAF